MIKEVFRVAHSAENEINRYLLGQALYYGGHSYHRHGLSRHPTRLGETSIKHEAT